MVELLLVHREVEVVILVSTIHITLCVRSDNSSSMEDGVSVETFKTHATKEQDFPPNFKGRKSEEYHRFFKTMLCHDHNLSHAFEIFLLRGKCHHPERDLPHTQSLVAPLPGVSYSQ